MKPTIEVEEEFRPIPGRTGYRVSNTGRVQSCRVQTGYGWANGEVWRDMRIQKYPSDYRYVQFSRTNAEVEESGKARNVTVYVHQLVALAFIGPCPAGQEVRHKNNDRADNRVENIHYGTHQQNCDDQLEHGTRRFGSRHQNSKLTEADVNEVIRLLFAREPPSKIAKRFNVSRSTIENIRSGKSWPLVPRPATIPLLRRQSSPARL